MKNASQIINSIQNKPQFSKLSRYKCIYKIQTLFSPALQKMIKFSYIKNDTLFFVLNHPGAKQEFDNNIQSIKSALKFITPPECETININDIKAFVTHTMIKKTQPEPPKVQKYPERSSGEWSVNIQDAKLNSLIKSIQDIIKAQNESA